MYIYFKEKKKYGYLSDHSGHSGCAEVASEAGAAVSFEAGADVSFEAVAAVSSEAVAAVSFEPIVIVALSVDPSSDDVVEIDVPFSAKHSCNVEISRIAEMWNQRESASQKDNNCIQKL